MLILSYRLAVRPDAPALRSEPEFGPKLFRRATMFVSPNRKKFKLKLFTDDCSIQESSSQRAKWEAPVLIALDNESNYAFFHGLGGGEFRAHAHPT